MTDDQIIDQECQAIVDQLRALRKQRGLSTYEVAERSGLKQPNVSRIERGDYYPNLFTLLRYAEAIGANITID